MNRSQEIMKLLDSVEHMLESSDRNKFACLMVNVDTKETRKSFEALRNKIPEADFYDKDNEWVDTFHVTALFGLQDDHLDKVKEILNGYGPIRLTVKNEIGVFDNSEETGYKVIHLPVSSGDLRKLHHDLRKKLEIEPPTFKTYKPHLTIAYVLPDAKTDYKVPFEPVKFEATEADFSTTDNCHTMIKIGT